MRTDGAPHWNTNPNGNNNGDFRPLCIEGNREAVLLPEGSTGFK